MVGYNPQADLNLTKSDHMIAGAASSTISRAIVQPLDVLKIRFQLQIEPISRGSSSSKYRGVFQAARSIVQDEGLRGLWKGHIPAQVLSMGYLVVEFTAFEQFTRLVWHTLPEEYTLRWKPVTHAMCGSLAASVATVAIQPLDVLRTRLAAQGEPKVYTSMLHACRTIVSTEGVRGFYKGLVPAVLGVAPQMGIHFGMYATLQASWNTLFNKPKHQHPGPIESFVCGSGSGMLAKLLIYPLDVLKKRLQIQGFEAARHGFGAVRRYSGLVHCVTSMLKEEGALALFKGLAPSLLKAAAMSGIIFCVYDQMCYAIAFRRKS